MGANVVEIRNIGKSFGDLRVLHRVSFDVADGEVAFQDVPHFHVHVIPRYPKDGFGLEFPPNYNQPRSRAELDTIASAIRAATGT